MPRTKTPDALNDPLAGTGYQTIRLLGRGGMGEVFEVEHLALAKRMVVKLLHRKLVDLPDQIDRFRLEGQALAHLRHPNLVSVTDFQITPEGRPFLVMERLFGWTLRTELIERGAIPAAEAVGLVVQALAGLAVVHDAGLVHRDIKLDNIFVCDPEAPGAPRVVKLLDFGFAKVVAANGGRLRSLPHVRTEEDVALGTPRYFSPEQARFGRVEARSDLYAMGLVLYALLAGKGPFDHHENVAKLVLAHIEEVPPPVSTCAPAPLPPTLDGIVARAIAKRPDDRFPSAEAFAAALTASLRPAPRWTSTEPMAPLTPRPVTPPRAEESGDEHSVSEDPTMPFRRPLR